MVGASDARVVWSHVLPNVLSPIIVQFTVAISQAIIIESSLSYLGLGTQPPTPSWGTMINEGRTFLDTAPWISVFPGLSIMGAVLAFNLLGDGLRDILDPRSRPVLTCPTNRIMAPEPALSARRLWKVNIEALLIATGQNLKRLLRKRGWGRRPWPNEAPEALRTRRSLPQWPLADLMVTVTRLIVAPRHLIVPSA